MGRCLGWGLSIGGATGLAAAAVLTVPFLPGQPWLGLVVPVAGLFYGVVTAIAPTALGTVAVVVVLVRRHAQQPDPGAVATDLSRIFAALLTAVVVIGAGWGLLWLAETDLDRTGVTIAAGVAALGVFAAWVCVHLLRHAATSIALAWCRRWGWVSDEELVAAAPGPCVEERPGPWR